MIRFAEIFYVFHVLTVLVGSTNILPDPPTKIGLGNRSLMAGFDVGLVSVMKYVSLT